MGALSDIAEELSNLYRRHSRVRIQGHSPGMGEAPRQSPPTYNRPRRAGAGVRFASCSLGKLAARSWKYSSADIDLMFFYGAKGKTDGPEPVTNKEFLGFFKKVAQPLYRTAVHHTAEGFVTASDLG